MSRLLLQNFRKDPPSSQYGSIQKLSILMILAGLFIMLVVIIAWFALDRVKERIQADVSDALQIVLHTTQESLNLWVESNKFQLTRLAEDPRLVFLVRHQLGIPRNQKALLKSNALRELRNFFRYGSDQFGQARFFIISPDFINIASMRDDNIGSKNLIANQALDLLNQAFRGKTIMVPPIWSDVPLISSSDGKPKKTPTMFFAAPVKNIQNKIIAVVTQRVDPSIDFTRLIQLGRIGKSGDTYAFGRYGKLLSESRFDEDLVKAGIVDEGETSILNVSVRDPGGDMTQGFTPSIPRYQQPLTLMAQQATKGKSGLNVEGYRDYRGVRVYGAWLWDDKLGVGLTTEINEADALGPYYTMRIVILSVLGITVLLALGSLMFAVLIDVRANRALQKSYDELELRVEERTAELKENQGRLEQAEERSRLLLESAEDGIFGVGKDGLVNFINPAGLAMLGFETDELIGQKIHPLIHHTRPDGSPYPIEECPMHHSLTQGVIGSRDDEVLWRKDGSSFPVEYTSVPIRKNDSIAGTVVVFRDISERKEAEEALRKSRATARGLLDATQESLLLLDKEGIIIAVNQTAAGRHQKTPEELIGANRFDLLPQNLRESRKAHFNNVLQSGNPEDFEDVRDGMVLHHIYYPVQDKTGAIMGVAIFAQDITERKRAEEAIRESQERLSTILQTTNQGFWLVDNDTVTLDVNDAMCEILDRTKEDIIGRKIYDFLDEENRAKVHKQEEMRSESKRSLYEVSLMRSDGKRVPCLVNASPLLDGDGGKIGSFGMFTEITERKHMEEELRRNVDELERFSKVAFGRERKMIQLKQEINDLMRQLGNAEKYKIVK
ncbi:MAG: PAS domain S-box protein [Desulfobacterales bacterium]|jgi:PAS domain S-box-containing protein